MNSPSNSDSSSHDESKEGSFVPSVQPPERMELNSRNRWLKRAAVLILVATLIIPFNLCVFLWSNSLHSNFSFWSFVTLALVQFVLGFIAALFSVAYLFTGKSSLGGKIVAVIAALWGVLVGLGGPLGLALVISTSGA